MTAPFLKHSIGGFTLKPKAQGFTLIELMISISIVAILATVGFVIYASAQRTARISRRIQDLKSIQTAVESFKAATGKYPVVTSTTACIENTSAGLASRSTTFVQNFMQTIPLDPLNNNSTSCYRYSSADGSNYKLWTFGVPAGDMGDADYKAQPALIDPQSDGTSNCVVDAGTVTAWAVYSDRSTCAF